MWMALTVASFAGNSQTTDTICLPIAQAKKVLADARQKPLLLEQIKLLRQDVQTLSDRIAVKQAEISNMEGQLVADQEIINQLKAEKQLYEEQKKIILDQVALFNKELRKEKRKRRWTAFGGLLSTGIMTYLFISK